MPTIPMSALLVLVLGCGSSGTVGTVAPRTADDHGTCTPPDIGDPSLYTLAADPIIGAPQTCAGSGPHEAYVHVVANGSHPFSKGSDGKPTGCTRPGPDCTTVYLGAFLDAVTVQLKARGVDRVTWGIGKCGVGRGASQRWDDLHWSFVIYDWRYANDAVTIVAEQLRAWDVSQSFEVSVEAMACGDPLSATTTSMAGQRWQCATGTCPDLSRAAVLPAPNFL